MKYIFKTENGDVEFQNQEEFELYLKGEKPELEKLSENLYKATFTYPLNRA